MVGVAFCLSVMRKFSTDDFSREHAVCPLSRIEQRPLVEVILTIVFSVGATAGVTAGVSTGGRVHYGRFLFNTVIAILLSLQESCLGDVETKAWRQCYL